MEHCRNVSNMNSTASERKSAVDWYADGYAKLLGREPDAKDIKVINRISDALSIGPNDAVWAILIALQYYASLYEAIPARIGEVTSESAERVKVLADVTMETAARDAQARLADAVATIAHDVAQDVSRKQKIRWISIAAVVISLTIGIIGWVGWAAGYHSGNLAGYQKVIDEKAAASWANTDQGKAAFNLSKSGYLDILIRCSRPGWEIKGGYCIPRSDEHGGIYGWEIPK